MAALECIDRIFCFPGSDCGSEILLPDADDPVEKVKVGKA